MTIQYRLAALLLAFPVMVSLIGCNGNTDTSKSVSPPENTRDHGPAPEGQSEPEGASAPVNLLVMDWASVEELIAAHHGKVVVVDLWSTSCIPCRKEFPNLVKLHEELGDKVVCISVSTDYDGIPSKPVETYRESVLDFLTNQGASFENVLCSLPAEDLFDHLKIGSIPAVFVYDQSGKRVKEFRDPVGGEEFTYTEHIRPFVDGLVQQ